MTLVCFIELLKYLLPCGSVAKMCVYTIRFQFSFLVDVVP